MIYILAIITLYILVISPKVSDDKTEKEDKKEPNKAVTHNGTGLNENTNKDGVSQGASGQMKFRIGYVK